MTVTVATAAHQPLTLPEPVWKDEMNFCEQPLTLLTDRAPKDVSTLEFYISPTTDRPGRLLTVVPTADETLRKIVSAAYPGLGLDAQGAARPTRRRKGRAANGETADELTDKQKDFLKNVSGLPTVVDDDVLLAMIQMTCRRNGYFIKQAEKGEERADKRAVQFSVHEIIALLGWDNSSKSYARVIVSLLRWKTVSLTYTDSWRDNEEKRFVTRTFNVLDEVSIFGGSRRRGRSIQGVLPYSSFTWNANVFKSFEDGFLKDLDFGLYRALKRHIARRMYRFLDKSFYLMRRRGDDRLSFDLRDFASGHIGLIGDYPPTKIKLVLRPAIEELEKHGIIRPLPQEQRYERTGHGKWRIVFHSGPKEIAAESKEAPPLPEELRRLAGELERRGVTSDGAAALVKEFPAERIAVQLEAFDWLAERKSKKVSDNPPGYLIASIRGAYPAPKGFEPKGEREQKQQAAAEAKRREQEQRATQRRQEEQEKAARKAEREHIDRYLKGLTPSQRKALGEQAIAHADEKMREAAGDGSPMAEVARRVLVDREVLRVCPAPPAADR